MKKLRALILAALGMSAPAGMAAAQPEQGCVPQILAALDMQTIADGRVTIPVQFEGHDHRLLVDTGGFLDTVTPQLVREEGYRVNPSRRLALQGMGARTQLDTFVQARDFALGQTHSYYRRFFVDDFNDLSADGTLVPSALAGYDVDLDFGHDRLTLVRPNGCAVRGWSKSPASVVPMEIQYRAHVRVPVTIDGKAMTATFDTGSTTSFLSLHAAAKFLGIDEKDARLTSLGDIPVNDTASPVYDYPFERLTFGGVTVTRPPIRIVSDRVLDQDDLILGMDSLRQFHLYIAYGEKKLYITPALAN
jgi:predicted aspartyl protease